MKHRLLIVDDEELIRWSLRERLASEDCDTMEAADGAAARAAIAKHSFDAALVDLRLPDTDGLILLREIHQQQPELPVIIITAYSSVEGAVRALKEGAVDYITKPFDMDELAMTVQRVLDQSNLRRSLSADLRQKNAQYGLARVVGESACIREVKGLIQRIAGASAASTVLLLGESGTGKDLVARAIHYESERARHPFMNITCTALPESLLESELFGHEAGAFTGATSRKKGLFEMAHHGTVFLDEIGDMAPLLQAKLLRVLEEKCFRRVGGATDIQVDVRIIAATNRPLEQQVEEDRFREDLYYRLNILPIVLPPLRERREDLPLLAGHFLDIYRHEFKKESIAFSGVAMQRLCGYAWPGNVRELRNVIERAVLLTRGDMIEGEDIILGRAAGRMTSNGEIISLPEEGCTLAEAEASLVRQALRRCGGNLTQAGRLLGISRDQVRYKLEKYGLKDGGRG
ncbi:MAG: sigma-54-dependent Fis family transcriptional regulator [Candidatus Hydrogenedentes bacterium]|nr:sigma-54-dependent Fis family transcriptional regulator [Candidatus Hydrogenedentota bacterium]